jgi:hypothetical protein
MAFAQIFPRSQPMRESNTSAIYQLVTCCEEGKAAENSPKSQDHEVRWKEKSEVIVF